MLPGDLDRALGETGCRTVFTTPVCQNPIGFESGEERRRAIVEVCRKRDAFIVEDDIYAIYAAKGRVTYRQLAPERTYYLTSLSKCLTPLVRLGILVPPQGGADDLRRAMRAQTFGVAPAALELGRALIELGADRTAAERLREEAKVRTELAQAILGLAGLAMPDGSPHIWLPLPKGRESAFAAEAETAGVLVTPPGTGSVRGGEPPGGIGFASLRPNSGPTQSGHCGGAGPDHSRLTGGAGSTVRALDITLDASCNINSLAPQVFQNRILGRVSATLGPIFGSMWETLDGSYTCRYPSLAKFPATPLSQACPRFDRRGCPGQVSHRPRRRHRRQAPGWSAAATRAACWFRATAKIRPPSSASTARWFRSKASMAGASDCLSIPCANGPPLCADDRSLAP